MKSESPFMASPSPSTDPSQDTGTDVGSGDGKEGDGEQENKSANGGGEADSEEKKEEASEKDKPSGEKEGPVKVKKHIARGGGRRGKGGFRRGGRPQAGRPGMGPVRVRLPRRRGGEIFGIAESLLGGSRITVMCEDGKSRMGRIPGKMKKREWIREGDLVIVKPWPFQDEKADVVWRYTKNQAANLARKRLIPETIDVFS